MESAAKLRIRSAFNKVLSHNHARNEVFESIIATEVYRQVILFTDSTNIQVAVSTFENMGSTNAVRMIHFVSIETTTVYCDYGMEPDKRH